jgi:hypothetical protein
MSLPFILIFCLESSTKQLQGSETQKEETDLLKGEKRSKLRAAEVTRFYRTGFGRKWSHTEKELQESSGGSSLVCVCGGGLFLFYFCFVLFCF